ncbi:MAG: hypothetical protein J5824_09540, partial [Lachnospiraceae bacterium]|nr:hypothetical protein [Lachnospiraceae bacterium]
MSNAQFSKIPVKKMMRFLAIFMSIMMIVGSVPADAAKKKTVTVKSLKSLISAMEDSNVGTIKFKSSKSLTITIPETAGSKNKKLYISASKARITNDSLFKSISVSNIKEFREEAKGNSITVKSNDANIVIAEGSSVKKLTFACASANAVIEKKAEVISLVCKKTSASVKVDLGKNAKAAITLSKKTMLTLTGDKLADINVVSKAKGSSVTASVPADIKASKSTSVTLEKGSEGSSVDSASKSIKVKITNNSDKDPVIKVAGEAVPSATPTPTPRPTATPTPKPTATPTPKPASGSDTGSGSTGGGSTGGSTGGGSTGGYTGGGSTG